MINNISQNNINKNTNTNTNKEIEEINNNKLDKIKEEIKTGNYKINLLETSKKISEELI